MDSVEMARRRERLVKDIRTRLLAPADQKSARALEKMLREALKLSASANGNSSSAGRTNSR